MRRGTALFAALELAVHNNPLFQKMREIAYAPISLPKGTIDEQVLITAAEEKRKRKNQKRLTQLKSLK